MYYNGEEIKETKRLYQVETEYGSVKLLKSDLNSIFKRVNEDEEGLVELLLTMEMIRKSNSTIDSRGKEHLFGRIWYRVEDFPERLEKKLENMTIEALIANISELKHFQIKEFFWKEAF